MSRIQTLVALNKKKEKKVEKLIKKVFRFIEKNNLKGVKKKVEKGFDINLKDFSNMNATYYAILYNREEIFNYFVSIGADLHALTDCPEWSLLHEAVKQGNINIIKTLLENEINVDSKIFSGMTPLISICDRWDCDELDYEKRISIVKLLLDNSANVNCVQENRYQGGLDLMGDRKRTALLNACDSGFYEIILMLIEKGADMKVKNEQGLSPIHFRKCLENPNILNLLLESGISANETREDGLTPIFEAIFGGEFEAVKILIENGADVNFFDTVKNIRTGEVTRITPLHYAINVAFEKGLDEDIIELLLENGANTKVKINENMDIDRKKRVSRILEKYPHSHISDGKVLSTTKIDNKHKIIKINDCLNKYNEIGKGWDKEYSWSYNLYDDDFAIICIGKILYLLSKINIEKKLKMKHLADEKKHNGFKLSNYLDYYEGNTIDIILFLFENITSFIASAKKDNFIAARPISIHVRLEGIIGWDYHPDDNEYKNVVLKLNYYLGTNATSYIYKLADNKYAITNPMSDVIYNEMKKMEQEMRM